jgi:hypothetical protein
MDSHERPMLSLGGASAVIRRFEMAALGIKMRFSMRLLVH